MHVIGCVQRNVSLPKKTEFSEMFDNFSLAFSELSIMIWLLIAWTNNLIKDIFT